MRWAQVTQIDPLRVQLDGETAPLPYALPSVVETGSLAVGQMVLVVKVDSMYAILGSSGGGGAVPIGAHLPGEFAIATVPDGYLLPDGTVYEIADYPLLAAHYAATYGAANQHGGDGVSTFAVPDSRERVYVQQGGADLFSTLGGKVGAKAHSHHLSDDGWANVWAKGGSAPHLFMKRTSAVGWTADFQATLSSPAASSSATSDGVSLGGATDAETTVQPSFVCRYVIRAF